MQLIDDLLDVSRVISGKLRLDVRSVASAESFGVGVRLDGVRVLVVDDDRDAVELISAILTAAPPPTR